MRSWWRWALSLALSTAAGRLGAQANRIVVSFLVTDSLQQPVSGVAVTVVQNLNDVLARGVTDSRGKYLSTLSVRPVEFQVNARRVGFSPQSRVLASAGRDTIDVALRLTALANRLDTIRVTAEQSAKRRRSTIDADAIAESDRPLLDAFDVLKKLRPSMLLEPPDPSGHCVPTNTWVNGKRIVLPAENAAAMERRRTAGVKTIARELPSGMYSILSSIKPEHIASIEYHDCTDTSVARLGGNSALFISLKGGIAYESGIGSYVFSAERQDSIIRAVTRASAAEPGQRYRRRVIGIFDADSGLPVVGVSITEVGTGTSIQTSESGASSLAFMREGGGLLHLTKDGYRSDTLTVMITPRDTLPLTVLLRKTGPG